MTDTNKEPIVYECAIVESDPDNGTRELNIPVTIESDVPFRMDDEPDGDFIERIRRWLWRETA